MRKSGLIVMLMLIAATGMPQVQAAHARQQADWDGTAHSLLTACSCQPADPERFDEFVYPSGLPMTPAGDPGWSAAEREIETVALFNARLGLQPADVQVRAQEVFAEARSLMDVRLAAGLAMLAGTSGEPAVEIILDTEWEAFGFGEMLNPDGAAEVPGLGLKMIFNPEFQHEDFLWFAPIMVHEVLHLYEGTGGLQEELVAELIDSIVLAELLRVYPELASQGTSLSRGQLTYLLAVVYNSNTVFEGREAALFPGGPGFIANMWENSPQAEAYATYPSLAPPVLASILANLGVDASAAPDLNNDGVPDYTRDLLDLLAIDMIIDNPESLLTGGDLRFVGEEALTLEFFGVT